MQNKLQINALKKLVQRSQGRNKPGSLEVNEVVCGVKAGVADEAMPVLSGASAPSSETPGPNTEKADFLLMLLV